VSKAALSGVLMSCSVLVAAALDACTDIGRDQDWSGG
jgi:hypothetical protein